MSRTQQAIEFAVQKHAGQFRKGTKLPYIVHPIAVMEILIRCNASEDAVVAGILHDTLEDTYTTRGELVKSFGERVAYIVSGCSENKALGWQERKQQAIDGLENTPDIDIVMVAYADKLSNLKSILQDYSVEKEKLWNRFNKPKDSQIWYYSEMGRVFNKRLGKNPVFADYNKTLKSLLTAINKNKVK